MIRRQDLEFVIAGKMAVDRAMEKLHTDNPAGYHADRPMVKRCPYKGADCPFTDDTPK